MSGSFLGLCSSSHLMCIENSCYVPAVDSLYHVYESLHQLPYGSRWKYYIVYAIINVANVILGIGLSNQYLIRTVQQYTCLVSVLIKLSKIALITRSIYPTICLSVHKCTCNTYHKQTLWLFDTLDRVIYSVFNCE